MDPDQLLAGSGCRTFPGERAEQMGQREKGWAAQSSLMCALVRVSELTVGFASWQNPLAAQFGRGGGDSGSVLEL